MLPRIEQRAVELAFELRLQRGKAIGVDQIMAGGALREAVEIIAVTAMRDDERAAARTGRQFIVPEIERPQPKPRDDRLGGLGFAEGRQHAARPVAGGILQRSVVTLEQGDVKACTRQQQGLPRACNACADDADLRRLAP